MRDFVTVSHRPMASTTDAWNGNHFYGNILMFFLPIIEVSLADSRLGVIGRRFYDDQWVASQKTSGGWEAKQKTTALLAGRFLK